MRRLLFRYRNGSIVREFFRTMLNAACIERALGDFDDLVACGMPFDTARRIIETGIRCGAYDVKAGNGEGA